MIWMWWSIGSHVKIEEELGDDTVVDIGVGTQGDSGLVTLANTGVDTSADTVYIHQETQVYTQ